MRIGEVARHAGVSSPTIRFYEAEQLLTPAERSSSGYRLYSPRVLDELAFIQRARRLGLQLSEIREILSLGRSGQRPCERVAAICAQHVAEIDRRMTELSQFRQDLENIKALANRNCGLTPEGFCKAFFGDDNSTETANVARA